ncbi:MAG: 1-deoxy-D-xylulose-5-phosphate synthase [Dorea sp.]|nr:1-deoxy-D-xylulose-5-phosphate synthase [Dorea sp.]
MLERIEKTNDVKKLNLKECEILAKEIRSFLVRKISKTGGHLASNLGTIELTIALHRVFDPEKDRLIWDVGHQSYTHKILTGRKNDFDTLRQFHGMSGFPKMKESVTDAFETGHSTTSISAGLGYVHARELKHEDYKVVAIIGDGSFTGGMAFEALNNAATLDKNFIIVLNDNHMSISENVGGMSTYLSKIRTASSYTGLKEKVTEALNHIPFLGDRAIGHIHTLKTMIKTMVIPGMFFEDMGITYLGPVPGHDIKKVSKVLKDASKIEGPVIVHILTEKGRGYKPATLEPSKFHGVSPFDINSGKPLKKKSADAYQDVFGKAIVEEAEAHENVVAITAAMADGTGLNLMRDTFPDRFFDVGIAEQHAVTFAAGLAAGGMHPVFAVYSSFLQRGYDQLIHDVAMPNLPVIFALDRAGLVGNDGETHQGAFDISYLSSVPNMTIMSPKNKYELCDMMHFAVEFDGPIAIRYPRGDASELCAEYREPIELGKSEYIFKENEIAILSLGHMFDISYEVCGKLKEQGYPCSLINVRFAKPLDHELLRELAKDHYLLVTVEDNIKTGGFGEQVTMFVEEEGLDLRVMSVTLPDEFVEHGNVAELRQMLHMDAESITKQVTEKIKELQE